MVERPPAVLGGSPHVPQGIVEEGDLIRSQRRGELALDAGMGAGVGLRIGFRGTEVNIPETPRPGSAYGADMCCRFSSAMLIARPRARR